MTEFSSFIAPLMPWSGPQPISLCVDSDKEVVTCIEDRVTTQPLGCSKVLAKDNPSMTCTSSTGLVSSGHIQDQLSLLSWSSERNWGKENKYEEALYSGAEIWKSVLTWKEETWNIGTDTDNKERDIEYWNTDNRSNPLLKVILLRSNFFQLSQAKKCLTNWTIMAVQECNNVSSEVKPVFTVPRQLFK